MHFIIVTGHLSADEDAALMVEEALRDRSLQSYTITDEEFLNNYKPNGSFIISLGGPSVNQLSSRIQEIYPRAIDSGAFERPNFCWGFGSKGGIRSKRHKLNSPCIALFGPQANDTLDAAKDFVCSSSLLDDIIKNSRVWRNPG